MISFANAGDAVKRLTGVIPATSDYTAIFWWQYRLTSGDRVPWVTIDDPAVYQDWIQFFSSGDFLTLSIGLAGVDHSSISQATEEGVLYPVAYVREGNEHRFYWNGGLVDTITLDITTATLGETWLGDDSFSNEADQEFYNFREWSRALSEDELYAEFTHPAAQATTLLVTDTPLQTDLLDISGNGNDWTAVGANSFIGTPPINANRYTATDIGIVPPGGYAVTVSPESSNHDRRYDLWFRFYAASSVLVTGAFGWSASGAYNPKINVYDQNLVRLIDPGESIFPRRVPVQFATNPGEVYYLQFEPESATAVLGSSTLELSVLNHDETVAPIHSFFINDTGEPFLACILSRLTNYLVHEFVLEIAGGEGGDTTTSGISLLEDFPTTTMRLYDQDYNELASFPGGTPGDFLRIRTNWTTQKIWYAIDANPVIIARIDPVAQTVGSPLTLTGVTTANGIATNSDETIAYITGTGVGDPIKAWDIVGNVALGDFYGGLADHIAYDALWLPNNTMLVLFYKSTATKDLVVKQFNSLGVIINSYEFGSDFLITKGGVDLGPPRITWGQDPNTSFWIMIHPDSPNYPKVILRETDVSTGSQIGSDVLHAFYNAGIYGINKAAPQQANPFARFGPSSSCPVYLTRSTTFTPATPFSGIYKLVPGKRNDTVWTDVNAQQTLNIKIPDPFAKTGMFGS